MSEYKPVKSTLEISQRIADFLEQTVPADYNGANRSRTIREANDVLQGRAPRTPENLLATLRNMCAEDTRMVDDICRDYQAYQEQMEQMKTPYTKTSNKQYNYKTWDADPRKPLKIIDQAIYDQAVKDGFPPGFFEMAYFDNVTIYCMPDNTQCNDSFFNECTFAACRIHGMEAWDARLYDCEFHSCTLQSTVFADSTLAHTHFHDCLFRSTAFIRCQLKHCPTRDSIVERINFTDSVLDDCSYGRIFRAPNSTIKGLDTAKITMGGATEEECRRNREAIFKALGLPTQKERSRKPPAPER